MKIALMIHFAFAILAIIVTLLIALSAVGRLRRKYSYVEIPKQSWAEKYFAYLRIGIIALIPVFNIIYVFVGIFNAETMIATIVHDLEKDAISTIERD